MSSPLQPLILEIQLLNKVDSAEACGDEPWFADKSLSQRLLESTRSAQLSSVLLEETQQALHKICSVLGSVVSPQMLEQPHAPLIAEASKLLAAVLGLTGEGVPMDSQRGLRRRAVAAFTSSGIWSGCVREELLSKWYDEDELLCLFAEATMRCAFEIVEKRFRAQFFCMLFRAAAVEAVRNDGNLRPMWPTILEKFPEVSVLQEFKDRLLSRVWKVADDQSDDDEPPEPELSTWATFWRTLMVDVLPSVKTGAASATDQELRCLTAALWKDIVEWFKGEYDDAQQHLDLFKAEVKDGAVWAFIPAMDLLLTVGDGMLTITAEGASTDSKNTQGRRAFTAAWRRATLGERKKRGLQCESQPKAKKAKVNRAPTRIVLLTNMVGPGDVDEDLEQETAEEVGKYGKLMKCTIRQCDGAPDNEAVRIFLEFARVEAASRAYSDLNGRYFGGRQVKARFFDEERYVKGDLERKGPNASRTLFLTNLCSRADVDEDLELETAEEASKFGKVLRCTVTVLSDAPESKAVQVFIEFDTLATAAKAMAELSGRVYDNRELEVNYVEDGTTSCAVEDEEDTACPQSSERDNSQHQPFQDTADRSVPMRNVAAVHTSPEKSHIESSEKTSVGTHVEADDESGESSIENMRDSETGLWDL